MKYQYTTKGTCSKLIEFEVEEGIVKNVNFLGGCHGNLQGIAALVEGMPIEEVIKRLDGIDCKGKGTSCPDQFAQALKATLFNE